MYCGTERTAMPRSRFVIPEICRADICSNFIPEEIRCQYHVGLLHNVGLLNAFMPQNHVHRCSARFIALQVNRFFLKISLELFIQESLRIEEDEYHIRKSGPCANFLISELQLSGEFPPVIRPTLFKQPCSFCSSAQ